MVIRDYKGELRIIGVLYSLSSITGPVGLMFAGPLADKIGVEKLFIISGLGTLVCGLVNLIVPAARNYDKELQQRIKEEAIEGEVVNAK